MRLTNKSRLAAVTAALAIIASSLISAMPASATPAPTQVGVYYLQGNTVYSTATETSTINTVGTLPAILQSPNVGGISGMAVGASHLYFAWYLYTPSFHAGIVQTDLDLSNPVQLPINLLTTDYPARMQEVGGRLYYSVYGSSPTVSGCISTSVFSYDLATQTTETLFNAWTSQACSVGMNFRFFVVDGSTIYGNLATNSGMSIGHLSATGSNQTPVAGAANQVNAQGGALANSYFYMVRSLGNYDMVLNRTVYTNTISEISPSVSSVTPYLAPSAWTNLYDIQAAGGSLFTAYQNSGQKISRLALSSGSASADWTASPSGVISLWAVSTTVPANLQIAPPNPPAPIVVKPAPTINFDSLKVLDQGKNDAVNLTGKNLDTYTSVTIGGKPGSISANTDTAVSFKSDTALPAGAYDIVLKTNGGGSLTIQGGYVVAAPAAAPVDQPKATIAPIRGVTPSVTSVNGFVAGKASAITSAQKSVVANAVTTNEAKSLTCVGVSSAKVSAKVAQARAAAICDYAKSLNPALVTSVSVQTLADLKAASADGSASPALVAPVVLNYLR